MTKFISTMMFFVIASGWSALNAQTYATGWRLAAEIPAGDSLWGGWDILTGFDLDNDGNKEFIYSRDPANSGPLANRSAGQTVYYYENAGDDTYELRWSFKTPIPNNASNVYSAIAMGDLDSDDKPELYFGTPLDVSDSPPNPKGLYVFEFDGTNFPAVPSENWGFGRPDNQLFLNSGLAIGDVDNDGEEELVVQSRKDDGAPGSGAGRTMMVVNSGGIDIGIGFAAFEIEFEESQTFTGGVVYDPRIVDFDGDGLNEIWVFTWDFFSLAIYEATAANTYELQAEIDQVFDPEDFGHRRGMRFYDADGDGKLEFYTAGIQPDNGPNGSIFYIGSTSDVSTLTSADVIMLGGKDLPSDGSAVGDIDGDGLMDFLFIARNSSDQGSRVYRMEYGGSGDLADSASYEWSVFYDSGNPFSDLRNLAIDDLDSDNKPEVFITRMNTLTSDQPVVIIVERETAITGITPQKDGVAQNFALAQNYPNPFNPTTSIPFDIKTDRFVTLAVYSILGKKVATLVNEQLASGHYSYDFDASKLPSGEYYYVLEAGDFRDSRKMILLK